ncbi:MAG: PilZ domain-containing protein [Gammaproteobacteria bacterium]|nr:PilZ domain-containing protein [Gammaproteobacteria bacterium]
MNDHDKKTVAHYKSVGRLGKQLVNEEVKSGSDTARFLERMEQRRLAAKCQIAIDMRGKVADKCEAYYFEGLTHYMDEKCIDIFETQVAKYDGVYTVGVYESVQNAEHTFRAQHEKEQLDRIAEQKEVMRKKPQGPRDPLFNKGSAESPEELIKSDTEDDDQEPHKIRLIPFGYRAQRKENRLNYVSMVSVNLPDGSTLSAKTSDISVAGIKLTMFSNINPIDVNQIIKVTFTGFEQQHDMNFGSIEYRLVDQTIDHHRRAQLRLVRSKDDNNQSFDLFIDEFIKSYQSRYKLELGDSLLSLYAKAFERTYTTASPLNISLVSMKNGKIESLYCAMREGDNSQFRSSLIGHIANNLTTLCADAMPTSALLECFFIKGQNYHRIYSANRTRLIEDKLFDDFLKVGSQAHLISRLHLSFFPIHKDDIEAAKQLITPLNDIDPTKCEDLLSKWENITHIGYYTTVEEKINLESRLTGTSSQLVKFADYRIESKPQKVWKLAYRNERKQPRYLYKTDAELKINNINLQGETIDFSPHGMRVKIQGNEKLPTSLEVNTNVKISLPEMQKLAKKTAKLSDLSYRVTQWHAHDNAISVKRDVSVKNHGGEEFFTRLIASNESKLRQCPEDVELTTIASMLESLISAYLPGIPLFISRFPGGRYAIDSAAATENANPLLWQFKTAGSFDFSQLNLENFFGQMLKGNLNRRSQLTKPLTARLFAKFPSEEFAPMEITAESEMKDTREIARFILMTRKSHNYRILQTSFIPPPYLKLDEFKDELNVIRANSMKKAKEFEQTLSQLVALVDVEDITGFYQQ